MPTPCDIPMRVTMECRSGVLKICLKPVNAEDCVETEFCATATVNSLDPVDIEADITFQCGDCAESTVNVHIFDCPEE